MTAQNSYAWGAGAPATGLEKLLGLDAAGNTANLPLYALRRPGQYRCDGLVLPKWRRARSRAQAGAGALVPTRGRILCIGDSTTVGVGAGTGSNVGSANIPNAKVRSWPTRLAAALSAQGVASIEQSFFGDNQVYAQNNVSPAAYDPRLSFSPAFESSGFSIAAGVPVSAGNLTVGGAWFLTAANGASMTFSPTVPVDTFIIYYGSNSVTGPFLYSINGGSTTSVATTSGTATLASKTVTATLGTNALTITNSGTTYTGIVGVIAYNSTSPAIDVLNGGRSGGVAADGTPASSYTNPWNPLNAIPVIAPDLTIINHGINEWRTSGYSVATFTAGMQAYITAAQQTGDVILMVPIPSQISGSYGSVPVAQQQTFQAALYALADSNNIPLLDMTYILGSGAKSASLGLMADQLHGLDTIYQDEAQQIANLLLAA